MGLSAGSTTFKKRTDTYTTTSVGSTVDVSTVLFSHFTVAVSTTGVVTSWVVNLEGSIDGVYFTPILVHTNLVGNGVSIFSGVLTAPCLYYRTNCTALVLGLGTNIVVTVVGTL